MMPFPCLAKHLPGFVLAALAVLPMNLPSAVQVVPIPADPAVPRNTLYPGNRAPLNPNPLIKLPIASIDPRGWIRRQLELQSAGFHGHLSGISTFLGRENNAWLSPEGQGDHGWEEVPYWLKGFGDCAYLIGSAGQITEARIWIEAALASQRPDGFFGPHGSGAKSTVTSTEGKYDLWPNMVMLMCLQSYHEFTGDPRVLDLMTRYFRWQLSVPEDDFLPPYWQQQRAADNLWSVYWLYNRIDDPVLSADLLRLAAKIHRHTADWTGGVANWHNVNMTQAFGGPTFYWMQSGETRHRDAAERNWNIIREAFGHVPGGLFAGDENCRPGLFDPRQAVETCGMAEMMFSCERLLSVTGDLVWAARCEDVAYNSLPAALTSDLRALRYLTAPNLAVSDAANKAPGLQNGGPMFHMNPHLHRCCQHNFGHAWPYFAEHVWMATPGNGLALVFPADSLVAAKAGARGTEIRIDTVTRYPFDESIELRLETASPVAFPLFLPLPGWCPAPQLSINGEIQNFAAHPGHWIRVDRTWESGDTVGLKLPMQISLRTWARNHDSASVDRGPLTFSLRIEESYVRAGGDGSWPGWEIHPLSPWNFALIIDPSDPARSFETVERPWPADNTPFTLDGAPVELLARARRVPEWRLDRFGLVAPLQASPVATAEPEEIVRLVPMGAARLRISAFPVAARDGQGHLWERPPLPQPWKVTASHCFEHDSPAAAADRIEPASSNDQTVPRFTWWDRKGSTEWLICEFEKPRTLRGFEVYWFDDSPQGGCRIPANWRLFARVEDAWKLLAESGPSSIRGDAWNRLDFPAIETVAVRLEAGLQEGFSAGILECRTIED
ncbi:MAG TPA: beta-L-arabinofuranosidase domain-containing protein [Verrucomicrobiales bacterium]|nr:beta-L-arabinofuranosidase domain-containing protein [Verrucomicrobiales bacterium]